MTLEDLTERSTEDVARARADRIRAGIHNYLETLAEIALAYERRDWSVLGYADWQGYVDGEFGAARLKLPVEHRQRAVAELRLANMSQRAIAAVVGVDQATVKRDIDRTGDASASPGEIRGADGKTYPAAPARRPAKGKDMTVWVAAARKGIAVHPLRSADFTVCGRSTRTGLTMLLSQAEMRYEVVRCLDCEPLIVTRFAAGEPAPDAGPAVEAHDPRASTDAGAERRDSAPATAHTETATGHLTSRPVDGADTAHVDETPAPPAVHATDAAAPASAPSPATSPAGDGAGVTHTAPPKPQLTVEQVARLRAVFSWARAKQARHPGSVPGRGVPRVIGREYPEATRSPQSAGVPGPLGGTVYAGERAAHVEVCWEFFELEITYRSDRHVIAEQQIAVPSVDEALDVLCALGILPAYLSRQYAAGVQAGMRAGDAIDGEWTETTDA